MKRGIIIISIFLLMFTISVNSKETGIGDLKEIMDVSINKAQKTRSDVVIKTTGEVKFHVFKVTNPPRLVIEMIDAVHNWNKKEMEVGNSLIKRVRSGQYKDKPVKIVRVVLDMAVDEYNYKEVTGSKQIVLSVAESEKELQEVKPVSKVKRITARKLNIERNIPTKLHEDKLAEIVKNSAKRDKEKEIRLKKIAHIKKKKKTKAANLQAVSMLGPLAKEPVDFNFKNADIKQILGGFAIKLDKNIITSDSVKGNVNFRIKGIPFEQAFEMLLERNGLVAVEKTPNIIEIMKKDEMPVERRTYALTKRNATGVATTLNGLLTSRESSLTTIAVDDTSNSIIVISPADIQKKISALISQFDIKAPQIKIKARLIEVQAGKDFTLGVTWAGDIPLTGNVTGVRTAKDFGNYSIDSTAGTIDTSNTIEGTGFATGGVVDISAVLNNTQLYGLLNSLATNSKSKTISEPTILTENNKNATIHVGRNLPVRTTTVSETGTTQSVTFIPEGVDLSVTPLVSPGSNQISMRVSVSISEFIGFQADNPITTERSANTEVTIESSKTVVIGGLIKERETQTNAGIPILKDIPLIGYLFKNRSSAKERTELLVFLTPEIISD